MFWRDWMGIRKSDSANLFLEYWRYTPPNLTSKTTLTIYLCGCCGYDDHYQCPWHYIPLLYHCGDHPRTLCTSAPFMAHDSAIISVGSTIQAMFYVPGILHWGLETSILAINRATHTRSLRLDMCNWSLAVYIEVLASVNWFKTFLGLPRLPFHLSIFVKFSKPPARHRAKPRFNRIFNQQFGKLWCQTEKLEKNSCFKPTHRIHRAEENHAKMATSLVLASGNLT